MNQEKRYQKMKFIHNYMNNDITYIIIAFLEKS